MSSRSPLTGKPVAAVPRRTQAERLASTRSRIVDATITYIDKHGFHQASLQQVARTAGVTVGAVQHHFSSKTELLTAVVEDSFRQLASSMGTLAFEGKSLQERIELFVDHSWQFCNSSRYQASLHILLGMRSAHDDQRQFEPWLNATLGQVVGDGFDLWQQAFHEVNLPEQERFNILLYLFSSLSGSALLARISQQQERVDSDLRVLKTLLLLRFTAGGPHE